MPVEAQAALARANSGRSPDRRLELRIGVHVGDVMVKGGDLFGDSVNIAARLQTLANAGGVSSSITHDQVRKILPLHSLTLERSRCKNMEESVRAFAVSAHGAAAAVMPSKIPAPLLLPDNSFHRCAAVPKHRLGDP